MKKNGNKVMIGVVAGVVVISGALWMINQNAGQTETLPQVEVVAAERGNVSQELDATGTVESQKKKTFFSPVNATISSMDVTSGDLVKKGEKLITFDLEDLEKENTKAELNQLSGRYDTQNTINKSNEAAAKQASAKANVESLESQVASWKQYVSDLQRQIAQAGADAQAEAQQQAAEAAAALAKQEQLLEQQYQEELKQYREETLPQYEKELEAALQKKNESLTAYNKADAEYQIAFQTWSGNQTPENQAAVAEKDAARSQAQIEMQAAEEAWQKLSDNPPAEPQKAASLEEDALQWSDGTGNSAAAEVTADTSGLQAELEEASSTLAELQSELASEKAVAESDAGTLTAEERAKLDVTDNLSELETKSVAELIKEGRKGITAEFDGVISDAAVTEGSAVTQGLQMFTLQSTEDVCVNISVSKYDYDKLAEGQKADITLGGNTYQGTVEKISRIASVNEKGAATISAQVKINDPDDNIFLGVDAKVVVHAKEAKDVLVVPSTVINIGKDGSFCYVVEDGVIVKKPVETGIASDTETEIISGLEENDAVVADIGSCEEGDTVEAVAEETEETGQ